MQQLVRLMLLLSRQRVLRLVAAGPFGLLCFGMTTGAHSSALKGTSNQAGRQLAAVKLSVVQTWMRNSGVSVFKCNRQRQPACQQLLAPSFHVLR